MGMVTCIAEGETWSKSSPRWRRRAIGVWILEISIPTRQDDVAQRFDLIWFGFTTPSARSVYLLHKYFSFVILYILFVSTWLDVRYSPLDLILDGNWIEPNSFQQNYTRSPALSSLDENG